MVLALSAGLVRFCFFNAGRSSNFFQFFLLRFLPSLCLKESYRDYLAFGFHAHESPLNRAGGREFPLLFFPAQRRSEVARLFSVRSLAGELAFR